MFNTIRGKITVITVSMLITLTFVMTIFSYIFLKTAKFMLLDLYSQKIGIIAQDINKEIMKFENNSKDLALLGEIYYHNEINKQTTEQAIIDTFKIYVNSLGGGVWYEPYLKNKNERRNCIYAFRNKQDKLVLDERFNSVEYDYPTQKWYKEIASKVKKENDTDWSSPYHESIGSGSLMITVGTGMFDKKGKFIGMSTVDWDMRKILEKVAKIKPTTNSFALFADKNNDYILISTDQYLDNKNLVGKSIKNIPWYNDNLKQITYFTYHNKKFIPYVKTLDNNMVLIVCIPKRELFANAVAHVTILFTILIVINMIIAQILYLLLKNSVMIPINKLTTIANKIGKGEEVTIKIENPQDFAHLAATFDKMTKNIKTITQERERINSELNIAKEIQASSLPSTFPAFADQNDFDIYASMTPAKEVGGDFYDFYFIDEDNFMFLIADVSGKGVPAALFMMTTKTLIHAISQKGYEPKELIETINKEICQSNKQGLFITMLSGIVNIKKGEITYINCGHNPPLIKTQNEGFKYLDLPSNIVLGAFDSSDFEIKSAQLKKGDTIFLYTDGVTEAMNKNGEMYGEERLLKNINNLDNEDLSKMTNDIKNDVINYCENEPQSDDLTMLIFKFKNDATIKTYKNLAIKDNYKDFYSWLHATCAEWKLSDALTNKIDMCAEEIYANVSFYSYTPPPGEINVIIQQTDNSIILIFEDSGVQYNPLAKPDPDITLPPEERPIGGLGIFMVKEMTNDMKYEYSDGKNRLILTFTN